MDDNSSQSEIKSCVWEKQLKGINKLYRQQTWSIAITKFLPKFYYLITPHKGINTCKDQWFYTIFLNSLPRYAISPLVSNENTTVVGKKKKYH